MRSSLPFLFFVVYSELFTAESAEIAEKKTLIQGILSAASTFSAVKTAEANNVASL